jgi:uncharacterized protein YybS (DUF2232 family)
LIKTSGVDGVDQVERKPEGGEKFQYIFLLSLVLILPGVYWPVFIWLNGFVALLTFFFLYGFGWNLGNRIILQGVLLACAVCFFLRSLPMIALSLTALPVGYVIAHAAGRLENQIVTGIKGILTLAICWLILWGGLFSTNDVFSYSALMHSLQDGLDVSLNVYRQNESMPVDTLIVVEQMINQMKVVLPKILPAILISFVIFTVWLTMVLGNRLALRYCGRSPWPAYKFWKVPEKLIWAEIVSGMLALIPIEPFGTIGINLLILVSVVFIFQGIALLVYFFDKWNMPVIFRLFLYTIAVIQLSGMVLLLVVGMADIWFNFRRLNS